MINDFPSKIIEFVISLTEYYIYCCKWSNSLPALEVLKVKKKKKKKIFEKICLYHFHEPCQPGIKFSIDLILFIFYLSRSGMENCLY